MESKISTLKKIEEVRSQISCTHLNTQGEKVSFFIHVKSYYTMSKSDYCFCFFFFLVEKVTIVVLLLFVKLYYAQYCIIVKGCINAFICL